MAQPAPCEMLVRGSGAAGPSLAWPMAPAGEHTAVVARQRPLEPFEAITAQECHREFATCSPDWHWAGAVAAMKLTGRDHPGVADGRSSDLIAPAFLGMRCPTRGPVDRGAQPP